MLDEEEAELLALRERKAELEAQVARQSGLSEPFSGLWNRRGDPLLCANHRLGDTLQAVGRARPYREKIGPLDPAADDLIWILPPGDAAPPMPDVLLVRLVGALDRGLAVLIWATDPLAIARARLALVMRGCEGRA